MLTSRLRLAAAVACVLCAAGTAWSAADVPGQKLDSGLGSLPHYSQWSDASGRGVVAAGVVLGESLDSGLGDLPPYALWADRHGRSMLASTRVEGESLDSGLGDLPPYALWVDRSGRDPMGREVVRLSSAQR